MQRVWVGADWDKEKCVVAYGSVERPRFGQVARTPEAIAAFVASFGDEAELHVGIESGDALWPKLWRNAGACVLVFDAKKAKRYAESLKSSYARDDQRSAVALRSMVGSESHRAERIHELDPQQERWHVLLTTYNASSQEVVRHTNRLWSVLQTAHPAFAAILKGLDAKWVHRVLEVAPTPKAWAELSELQRDQALKGTRHDQRSRYAEALETDFNVVPDVVEQPLRQQVRSVVAMLKTAMKVRRAAEAALDEERKLSEDVATIRTTAGVGPVLGVGFTLALKHGASARPGERDAAAILTGAAPVTIRSGVLGDRSPMVSMRRSAAAQMRPLPHHLGLQLVRRHRWAKQQHAYYKQRGRTDASSFRRITRSFLRVLSALLRDGTHFDEDKYIRTARAKGAPWALTLPAAA